MQEIKEKLLQAIEAAKSAKSADALEKEVDDELWPLPKYSEVLFIY